MYKPTIILALCTQTESTDKTDQPKSVGVTATPLYENPAVSLSATNAGEEELYEIMEFNPSTEHESTAQVKEMDIYCEMS